ncbi:FapA family protein [Carboxydothermus pertinax]|uniref:Flagellar Assembly Protein A N-terminal region domain-containing protein n=1 Tax=Carboxydothermus pertinax TaxID=870242 RepID=A0A1L8CUJ3_9THEO|nr:FapA family protein [Carboxydothermus pertinax]GAV22588.1 hypothetical protein cpu_10980 [Carboxydothermus pertinax]
MTDSSTGSYWEVKVSNNNLEAYLKFSPLTQTEEGAFPSLEELKEFLKAKGIIYGIIEENLPLVLDHPGEFILVARGIEPVPPVPDELITYFESDDVKYSMDKLGHRVYYFKSLPQVTKGQVLAEVRRGKPGKNGVDIFGKPIKAPAYVPLKLKVHKGAEIKDDKVIATINGLPVRIGNAGFDVQNLLQLDGDLFYKTGNYQFIGSIKVNGNVRENVLIKAEGSVEVFGSVESAKIYAGESFIARKNIINSEITVGLRPMLASKVNAVVSDLVENLNPLILLIAQLLPNLKDTPVTLFRILQLLYKKPDELRLQLEKLKKAYQRLVECKPEMEAFWSEGLEKVTTIEKIVSALLRTISETVPAHILQQKINLWWHVLTEGGKYFQTEEKMFASTPYKLTVYSGQNARFNVYGDFILNGKSLYQCVVNASGVVFGESGTSVVGGVLTAGKAVALDEVGAPIGTGMEIIVGKNGTVKLKKVYPGVVVKIGRFQKIFKETEYQVFLTGEKDL